MLRHRSLSGTPVTTTGEPANGANAASGANMNGAVSNGVSMSGASVMNGVGIETTSDAITSAQFNL